MSSEITKPATSPPREVSSTGCGFLGATCVVSCVFLFLNVAIVSTLYPVLAGWGPELLKNERVAQAILYAAPILLVFCEWWLVDWVVAKLRRK